MYIVQGLSLYRDKKRILDDVSFQVQRGEYLALIGPNGAGKSTLLKCLDKIATKSQGDIFFDGKSLDLISQKSLARRVAYVQQSLPTTFSFTVRQFVEMGRFPHLAALSPITQTDQDIVTESLRLMEMESFASRYVHTLSGGEMQRVQIATALTQQAEVLLLDEPTTYLDYRHQSEIGRILRTLNQQYGKTIIEVTHDVNRAVLDATHVIALVDGKVIYDGSPAFLMNPTHLRNIYQVDFQMVDHPSLPLKVVVPGI